MQSDWRLVVILLQAMLLSLVSLLRGGADIVIFTKVAFAGD
jgi:hypothetical protein